MPRRVPRPPDAVPVLITGVEGGGVTLYGRQTPNGWEYYVAYADQTPVMLDEPEIRRETCWTRDWDEALAYLDRERWLRLPPIMVQRRFGPACGRQSAHAWLRTKRDRSFRATNCSPAGATAAGSWHDALQRGCF